MQKNWIGRSEGLLVRFALDPKPRRTARASSKMFTTRPDTLFGAKFMALSPDHPLAQQRRRKIRSSRNSSPSASGTARRRRASRRRRSWASTPASRRVHPFDPNWKLPVYVANFMLMDYGTGAIFGCPAHDQRDLDFVNKYGLGVTPVVCPPGQDPKISSSPTRPMRATAA